MKITKKDALAMLQTARYVTVTKFEGKDIYGVLEKKPATRLMNIPRRVTDTRSSSVKLGESWVDIDARTNVELDDEGQLIVTGIDGEGEPWVRITYKVEK